MEEEEVLKSSSSVASDGISSTIVEYRVDDEREMVYRLLCWIEYVEGWNANDTQDVNRRKSMSVVAIVV